MKAIKALCIGLSIHMALSPMVVYADELSEAENSLAAQIEVRNEAANNVEEAVANAVISDAQVEFENNEIVVSVEVSEENPIDDTSALVENEISRIEDEVIKEVTEAIVNVDMSDVDDALGKVTELVENVVTDETVATEIETTADALIDIYDTQATAALNALKAISQSENVTAVTVNDDGTVVIDWTKASDEVVDLYKTYTDALKSKGEAESARADAEHKQIEASEKSNKANEDVATLNAKLKNDETANEAILNSKNNKDKEINEIIANVAELKKQSIVTGYTFDQKFNDNKDMCRFFINKVEDGIAYGCLTYYDSVSKTILRKNFKISSDTIDYEYVPKAEWVKGDSKCKEVLFGNGGNYVAAYIGDGISSYLTTDKATKEKVFNGSLVSNIMRDNLDLNVAIEARSQALKDLEDINKVLEKAEEALTEATNTANSALSNYEETVKMYKKAAELDAEIKKDAVEKAKLEYVKAEVEVWRKQQKLNQVKSVIKKTGTDDKKEVGSTGELESIETVVVNIASNLGVAPESVESLVVQTIIDTEDSYIEETNNVEAAVAGVRKNDVAVEVETEVTEETEEVENTIAIEKEEVEETIDAENATNGVITIEDNMVPLAASVGTDAGYSINWWILIIALACATWFMFIVAKKNKKEEEEANR